MPNGILAVMTGPQVRTEIVDVYVFRLAGDPGCGGAEFLQLRRARGQLAGTWQPVMGHVQEQRAEGSATETAVEAALRELAEETRYAPGRGLIGFWQLQCVNTYFLASQDCVMMSPCFAARVAVDVDPVMDAAHDQFRWVRRDHVERCFVWPGQRTAIDQVLRDLVPAADADPGWVSGATVAGLLRIDLGSRS